LPKYDTNTATLRNTPLSDPRFVHLRLHTDYSLVDGVVRVKELIKTCASQAIPAVAVTDDSNLFAMIKFYSAAMNAGVKPLMGADLWVESAHIEEPAKLSFLVQNEQVYQNLTLLISRAWQTNQDRGRALVKAEWLEELHEGLIVLSAASQGEVGQLLLAERTDRRASRLAGCSLFMVIVSTWKSSAPPGRGMKIVCTPPWLWRQNWLCQW